MDEARRFVKLSTKTRSISLQLFPLFVCAYPIHMLFFFTFPSTPNPLLCSHFSNLPFNNHHRQTVYKSMEMGSERMLKYGLKNMWRKLELKLINNKIKLRRGREVTVMPLFMHIRACSPNFIEGVLQNQLICNIYII